jgi:SAM-dependent methyltransferase
MKPSQYHSNRQPFNWILYDLGDKYLIKYSKYLKGDLYDLGCGDGAYKEYFLQFVDNYIGVDWSNTQHNSAADIVSNLNEKIDVADNSADSIISMSVMEHLCEPQIFLNEAFRILKSDSHIVLQVPWQWWIHEAPHDYFRYTPYGLEYMFKKAGFVDIQIEAQTGFFTTWIVKMNYFSTRFIRGNKVKKAIIKGLLWPFWNLGQILAPHLDKLDRHWARETQGFFVVATKPS